MANPPVNERPESEDVTVTRIGSRTSPAFTIKDVENIQGQPVAVGIGEPTGPSFTLKDLEAEGYVRDPQQELTSQQIQENLLKGVVSKGAPVAAGVAGAIAGAKATAPFAAATVPFLGPASISVPIMGGAIGAVTSYLGAKTLADSLIEQPNPEDIAYVPFEMGGTFGETIATAPLAFYIPASLGLRFAGPGRVISSIGEGARRYPKSFLLGETTAGASTAAMTGVALTEFEGDPMARFLLETAGGFFDPLRYVPLATSKGVELLKTAWQLRSEEGRAAFAASRSEQNLDKATQRLITIFEENGEDIPELIKQLEAPLIGTPDVSYPSGGAALRTGPTAAQKTGSLPLAQLEAALSALDPKFAADVTEQGKQALRAYSLVIQRLSEIGNPEALRTAATLRQDFFNNALEARLNRAMENARVRISKITRDTPQARVEIGRIIKEEVERAEQNAREAERIFWQDATEQALKPVGTQKITEVVPSGPELNAAYNKKAEEVLTELRTLDRKYGNIDFNNARQVSRLTGQKAVSISEYFKQKLGGIAIDSEWRSRGLDGRTRPGLFLADTPANRGRAGIDSLREAAFSGGYFPGKNSYLEITDDEIFDAVASDTSRSRFWQAPVREALADVRADFDYLKRNEEAYGLRPDMSQQQIAARLRAIDEARSKEGREDLFVPMGKQRKVTRTVPRPNVLVPQNTINTYLERLSEIGEEYVPELVPSSVIKTMKKLGITPAVISRYKEGKIDKAARGAETVASRFLPRPGSIRERPVIELIQDRSVLLTLARQARARGDLSHASFYSDMAEAMLKDLSTLPGEAYDVARNYSRALNDTFTRTFAGDLLGTTKTGARRYPADTLVEDAFGVGADRVALRMREIEGAIGFLQRQLDDAVIGGVSNFKNVAELSDLSEISSQGIVSIQHAQNRVLRLLANKATYVDPKTQALRVNTKRLNEFVAENKDLLDTMGITGDLQNAAQAENLLAAVLQQNSRLNKHVRNQMAFAKLTGVESPTTAIANALSPNNRYPTRSMRQLANLARKAGPEAVEGLKASIYDYIFTKASGGTSNLNAQLFYDAFFKKRTVDQPELASILRTSGIMTPDELKNIRAFANQMRTIEDAMANRTQLENVLQGADIMGELVMRVVGSRIGTSAAAGGPGSLIAASAGSKAIRKIFDKMPMMMVKKIIQEAAQNPQFMAQLLKRGMSEREKLLLVKRLHSYLAASGLNYATYEPPPEEEEVLASSQPGQPGSAAYDLQSLQGVYDAMRGRPAPPAPTTRGVPGLPSGGPPPPAGGGGGAPPPTTQSRMMLQQLFPNDAIMGAAAMQAGMPPMPG